MANDTPDADRLLSERAVLAALEQVFATVDGPYVDCIEAVRALPSQPAASVEVATLERVRCAVWRLPIMRTGVDHIGGQETMRRMLLEELAGMLTEARAAAPGASRPKCVRCGAAFDVSGACTRRAEGCQGGWGEAQPTEPAACSSCNDEGGFYVGNGDTWTPCACRDPKPTEPAAGERASRAPAPAAGANVEGLLRRADVFTKQAAVNSATGLLVSELADALRSERAARVRAEADLGVG